MATSVGRGSLRRGLALVCAALAALLAADAGWLHAKAYAAQMLLERSWQRGLATGEAPRPWPWADTLPVARLLVPGLGRRQIVLAGDSGRSLAFGPGWAPASASPGQSGTIVISGHRDTHFAWLQHLQAGDRLLLEAPAGSHEYLVTDLRVANADHERIGLDASDGETLLLVTCWPFDAVASGPLRYVVTARRVPGVQT